MVTRMVALIVAAIAGFAGPATATEVAVLASDLAPLSVPNNPERPGFNVELVKALFQRAEIPYTLAFLPWARAQYEVTQQPDAVIIGLARIASREAAYKWVVPLIDTHVVFFTTRKTGAIDTVEEARRLNSITVRAETPFAARLAENGFQQPPVEPAQSEEINARKLQAGRADAWLTYDLRGLSTWKQQGFDAAELVRGKPISSETVYLAANLLFPEDTAERLRAALAAITKDGTYEAIRARYFDGPH